MLLRSINMRKGLAIAAGFIDAEAMGSLTIAGTAAPSIFDYVDAAATGGPITVTGSASADTASAPVLAEATGSLSITGTAAALVDRSASAYGSIAIEGTAEVEQPFAPNSLTGLGLWLDASDASTLYDATAAGSLVAVDGAVARWEDKSGSARHAIQSASGNRPLRKAAVQNSLDALLFDGANDAFAITTGLDLLQNVSGATVFVVAAHASAPSALQEYIFISRGTDTDGSRFEAVADSGGVIAGGRRLDADAFQGETGVTGVATDWMLISAVGDYANTDLSLYREGALDASTASWQTSGLTSNTASDAIDIARWGAGNARHLDGHLAEIIVYSRALTDTERQQVEAYLAEKWATTYNGVVPASASGAIAIAGTATAEFDPKQAAGLELWLDGANEERLYDATIGGSLAAPDGNIARWEDSSGNDNHAVQSSVSARPLRRTAQQNGLDVVDFSGDDYLKIPGLSGEAGVIYWVMAPAGATRSDVFGYINGAGSPGAVVVSAPFNASGDGRVYIEGNASDKEVLASGAVGSGEYSLWKVGYGGTTFFLWINGVLIGSASNTGFLSAAEEAFFLGASNNQGTPQFPINFPIAEFVAYSGVLNSSEEAELEHYLANKWDIRMLEPPDIDTVALELWLDAADASTLFSEVNTDHLATADGAVARWEDKSIYQKHVTESTGTKRPLRKDGVQNGLGVVRFDGIDDHLAHGQPSVVGTVFAVCVTSSLDGVILADDTTTYVGVPADDISNLRGRLLASSPLSEPATNVSSGAHIITVDVSQRMWVDGVSVASSTAESVQAWGTFRVGDRSNTADSPLDGDICEILVFSRTLTALERFKIHDYLSRKWGIALS